MSNIKTAYTAITAFAPAGVTTSRNITACQLEVADADLPCRILLPSTQLEGDFIMMGNTQSIGWAVRDLCLWAPLGSGTGIEQYAEAMLDYIISYVGKVKAKRSPADNCTIAGFEVQMAPVPWKDLDYWAIDITLTISEVI